MFENVPIRSSCPSGVNNTRRVSAPGNLNSIQRCLSSNGWSVATFILNVSV
jgi:hypothetical protein